jgi:hypothetical protein
MLSLEVLRQFRLGEYAIFDLTVTFIGMALLAPLLSKLFLKFKIEIPKKNWIILALPIGILAHLLVGRLTPMTRNFLDLNSHYLLKVLIIGLSILGLRNIKKL